MPTPNNNTRIGMHYFPDTDHYQESDLRVWLPKLISVKATWVTLQAPSTLAIPEHFIRGLVDAGIEPVLQFDLPPDGNADIDDMQAILAAYAGWGVHYVSLFDRPNNKDRWSPQSWARTGLVERFTTLFVRLASQLMSNRLTPIFPALEPGGDYWDTAFLRTALQFMEERGKSELLDTLVLGCYAWAGDATLNWGAGGPERWAGTRPYSTPEGEENQLGFRIFDWYTAISEAALGKSLPIIILAGGSAPDKGVYRHGYDEKVIDHAARNLQIAKLMADQNETSSSGELLEAAPKNVLSCNFWLLADECDCEIKPASWFQQDGSANASAQALVDWKISASAPVNKPVEKSSYEMQDAAVETSGYSFQHYLLLPIYEWGVADWHLDVIRPFIKKHVPTVGFSVEEAAKSKKVTIVGGERSFSSDLLKQLHENGCEVEQIDGDGTSIATQLMNL